MFTTSPSQLTAYPKMDAYNPYSPLYLTQEQIDAYNAQFPPQKPIEEPVAIDPTQAYNQAYLWNQVDQSYVGMMEQQQYLVVQPEQTIISNDLWQQQLDYSNASNAQYLETWAPQPQPTYPYQLEPYPHMNPGDMGLYNQVPMMSPPMTISTSYSACTNELPQSWASNLSTTPPNEYHSSGSDGGSDDLHHSHGPPGYPSAAPNGHWHPAPTPITPEPEEEPVPEPSSTAIKKSFYRPRHLQNVSNITRSLVRQEGAVPPRPQPHTTTIICKKKKACSSCKKRKISCAPPTVGVKCNQCQRTGYECDLEQ